MHKDTPVLIIDASGLLYRSFFALPPLTSPSGIPSGALFGFIRSVLKVLQKIQPHYVVAVFDGPDNKKSRLAIYKEYKAHRKPTPDELRIQIDYAKKFCSLWNMPSLTIEGVEADDTIASVTHLFKEKTASPIFLCTADKDLCQLIDEQVLIINPAKDDAIIDKDSVEKQYGILPTSMVDYLSLIGDSSDNVPGIAGIGPKTAVELLKEYHTLENLFKNASSIPGKKGEKIAQGMEEGLLSKQLILLQPDLPVPKDLSFYIPKLPDKEECSKFFITMGFSSLLQLFPTQPLEEKDLSSKMITQFEEIESALKTIPEKSFIFITTQYDVKKEKLLGVCFGNNQKNIFYIDTSANFSPEQAVSAIASYCVQHLISIVSHDTKALLHELWPYCKTFFPIAFDTSLASWLLFPDERSFSLTDVSRRLLLQEKASITSALKKGETLSSLEKETLSQYAVQDLLLIIRLYDFLQKQLVEKQLLSLYENIELALIPVLFFMELTGVYIDTEILSKLEKSVKTELEALSQEIYSLAGKTFNINSPKQLSEILFVDLQLPKQKKGKQHLSTDVNVLESLVNFHPIAKKILEYRQLDKLYSTYITALPLMVAKDGRVHCTLDQTGTATGRIACHNPNLQNIPIKTPLGKEIRSAFCPQDEKSVYISADYSQIELRILAHMSNDPALIDAFSHDQDIHATTASTIFHLPANEITENMRRKAKAVNFGLIYGQTAFGLSKELKISPKEAQEIIDRYFSEYATVKNLLQKIIESAKKSGFSETLLGRRRFLPDLKSTDFFAKSAAERLAINTPFQGTGADIIKIAMLKIAKALHENGLKTKMILQIHDELLFEVPESEIETIVTFLRKYMEDPIQLNVPLKVNISIGKNWKEC